MLHKKVMNVTFFLTFNPWLVTPCPLYVLEFPVVIHCWPLPPWNTLLLRSLLFLLLLLWTLTCLGYSGSIPSLFSSFDMPFRFPSTWFTGCRHHFYVLTTYVSSSHISPELESFLSGYLLVMSILHPIDSPNVHMPKTRLSLPLSPCLSSSYLFYLLFLPSFKLSSLSWIITTATFWLICLP